MGNYVSVSNDYFTGEIFEISKSYPKEESDNSENLIGREDMATKHKKWL